MKKAVTLLLILISFQLKSQFGAPPGEPGTTAIHKDSSIIIGWASGIQVQRGLIDIANPTAMDAGTNEASYGDPQNAVGPAGGNSTDVVSLGDSGIATLTFDYAIVDRPGPDFCVFENGFGDDFIELAFVEVSSDGINFVRFPATSQIPTAQQVGPFETIDLEQMHNLAGKYRQGYGTPFDLSDVQDSSGIDVQNITHVRIVDVVGSIDPNYASFDAQGTLINDPYPTDFASGGFDLDGVGVIHFEGDVNVSSHLQKQITVYPNPTSQQSTVYFNGSTDNTTLRIVNAQGKIIVDKYVKNNSFTIDFSPGMYQLYLYSARGSLIYRDRLIVR